jgi:2-keto-4-pentenoate hydratase/2-oxohepta-3-ene-1,7-dioic acid hydratase in catechol pathway
MRFVRYAAPGGPAWARVEGEDLLPLARAPWEGVEDGPGAGVLPRREARLLPPATPGKILCIGRNYRAHAAELGHEIPKEPLVFFKPATSLLPHHGTVLLPPESERVDYEGELAFVIGRRARRVPKERWREVVFGYTVALDVTARDLQKKDGQWWRAKGFDTFCPLGPALETDVDASDLLLETRVDGELRQSGRTRDFIFDLPTLVSWLSAAMTLEPGDVVLTGTPEGVGPLAAGQSVEVSVEKVGRLLASVAREDVPG